MKPEKRLRNRFVWTGGTHCCPVGSAVEVANPRSSHTLALIQRHEAFPSTAGWYTGSYVIHRQTLLVVQRMKRLKFSSRSYRIKGGSGESASGSGVIMGHPGSGGAWLSKDMARWAGNALERHNGSQTSFVESAPEILGGVRIQESKRAKKVSSSKSKFKVVDGYRLATWNSVCACGAANPAFSKEEYKAHKAGWRSGWKDNPKFESSELPEKEKELLNQADDSILALQKSKQRSWIGRNSNCASGAGAPTCTPGKKSKTEKTDHAAEDAASVP